MDNLDKFQFDTNTPLLDRIDILIAVSRGSKLNDIFFVKYHELILSVAEDLQLDERQAVLLMPFIANPDEILRTRDIVSFFELSPTTLMRCDDDLTCLVHRRYLYHGCQRGINGYGLTQKAKKALSKGQGLKDSLMWDLSPNDFMKAINELFEDYLEKKHLIPEEFHQRNS